MKCPIIYLIKKNFPSVNQSIKITTSKIKDKILYSVLPKSVVKEVTKSYGDDICSKLVKIPPNTFTKTNSDALTSLLAVGSTTAYVATKNNNKDTGRYNSTTA